MQGLADIFGAGFVAARYQHDRATQVGRDLGIELKFKDRILAQKIRAHAQHEIVLQKNFLEFLDDVFQQQIARTLIDDFARLGMGIGEGIRIIHVDLEMLKHQVDVRVAVIQLRLVDDGPEEGHVAHVTAEHLHGAQGYGAFAGQRPRGRDVQCVVFHRNSLAGAGESGGAAAAHPVM